MLGRAWEIPAEDIVLVMATIQAKLEEKRTTVAVITSRLTTNSNNRIDNNGVIRSLITKEVINKVATESTMVIEIIGVMTISVETTTAMIEVVVITEDLIRTIETEATEVNTIADLAVAATKEEMTEDLEEMIGTETVEIAIEAIREMTIVIEMIAVTVMIEETEVRNVKVEDLIREEVKKTNQKTGGVLTVETLTGLVEIPVIGAMLLSLRMLLS